VKRGLLELRLAEIELRRWVKMGNWRNVLMGNVDLDIELTDTAILIGKERVDGGIETT
jgi:hypothetical protein